MTVRDVIAEVDARDIPELVVFNKADLADETQRMALRGLEPGSFLVSAKTGEGINELLAKISDLLPRPNVFVRVLIPYNRGELVSRIHLNSTILDLQFLDSGTQMEAMVNPALASELEPFFETN
jgi:GTP-binding protein HflX